ncbi:MAG: hypothetical protein HY672_03205 [Chloroflexi bacterium]|nr:hypothetical protein [Chloroflexota bacterium]
MPAGDKQVAFKVDARDYELFEGIARRLGMSPYAFMKTLIETWASAEDLVNRLESGATQQPEAFAELGRLVQRLQVVLKLNGAFQEAVERIYAHYGVSLQMAEASGGTDEKATGGR